MVSVVRSPWNLFAVALAAAALAASAAAWAEPGAPEASPAITRVEPPAEGAAGDAGSEADAGAQETNAGVDAAGRRPEDGAAADAAAGREGAAADIAADEDGAAAADAAAGREGAAADIAADEGGAAAADAAAPGEAAAAGDAAAGREDTAAADGGEAVDATRRQDGVAETNGDGERASGPAAGDGASDDETLPSATTDTAANPADEASGGAAAGGAAGDGGEADEEAAAGAAAEDSAGESAAAEAAEAAAEAAEEAAKVAELCAVLTAAADAHGVPHDFFIRLIWKESRFNDGAVSPVGAQGIAQFMPGTARLRGLDDPFNREKALYASAAFLADLRAEFGSWGLAAAGYNGGPNRLPALIAGEGSLPYETVDYVFSITGRPAEFWAARARARIVRGERGGAPGGWIGRGLTPEEVAALSPSSRRALEASGAVGSADGDAAEPAEPPEGQADDGGTSPSDAAADEGAAAETAAAAPDGDPGAGDGDAAAPVLASVTVTAAEAPGADQDGPADVAASAEPAGAVAAAGTMPAHPPTLLALARPPFALPVPRARPDFTPAVDCPALVARLGRSRSVAPPSVAGGWSPWGAQVAGHVRRDMAMRQYERLKGRLPGDLVAEGPNVVIRRFAARGRLSIHAVQFAAQSRGEAEALCARVASSRAPCVVVRNR